MRMREQFKKWTAFVVWTVWMGAALGCEGPQAETKQAGLKTDGTLPVQSEKLVEEEWQIFRGKHAEMDENEARRRFDAIQTMSAKARETYPQKAAQAAAWAERRALAQKWLETRIEKRFSRETLLDRDIQLAIDAYAFESGHPALVTASHLLIKDDKETTPAERVAVLEAVRNRLLALDAITNEALSEEALRLVRAGYVVDLNCDMTFPRYPMQSFMGEQLSYGAMVEPFSAAAFALNEDHVLSPVVETPFGHHIILYIDRTEEKKPDLEDVREYMIARILEQGRKRATEQALIELQSAASIGINEQKMSRILQGESLASGE